GQSVTFTVAATGGSLSYQWQHLIGATWRDVGGDSPAYTIAAPVTADAGPYRVMVSSSTGTALSDTITLSVSLVPPPPLAPGLKADFSDFTGLLTAMPNLAGRAADVTRTDPVIDYLPTKRPWTGLDARFANNFAVQETGFLEVSAPGRYKISL